MFDLEHISMICTSDLSAMRIARVSIANVAEVTLQDLSGVRRFAARYNSNEPFAI